MKKATIAGIVLNVPPQTRSNSKISVPDAFIFYDLLSQEKYFYVDEVIGPKEDGSYRVHVRLKNWTDEYYAIHKVSEIANLATQYTRQRKQRKGPYKGF